jgi:predicted kinase
MMPKLTILRGISGSGKSTWARQQNATVVSRDAIRDMLFPLHADFPNLYYAVPKDQLSENENRVSVVQDSMIAGLLKAGQDVIVDNTNIEWKYVRALARIGYRHGAEVEVKVFDVDVIEACRRDDMRFAAGGRSVGHNVISKQHERFKANKSMTLEPVQDVKPYTGTPGMPKAFMVDIDGTLAHMGDKRGPFEWHNVGLDDVDETIAMIVRILGSSNFALALGHLNVIVMSGRDEVCREQTEEWLELHGIVYDELFMRPEKDMRPDNIVKAELFDTHVRDNYDVQFVLDDRDQVVEMWRRMGLKVLQVAEGDF